MLLRADHSIVLVIDMQERLMPVIDRGEQVLATADKLARAARLLDVPVVATEHHSRMLGATVAPCASRCRRLSRRCISRPCASRGLRPGCRRRAKRCW